MPRSKHSHEVINTFGTLKKRDLHEWSYSVMAPYFTKLRDRHVHYVLDHNDVLPILRASDHKMSGAPSVARPSNKTIKTAKGASTLGGAFSHVLRVTFDPSHIHFGSEKHLNEGRPFALKKLTSTNVTDFNIELASLLSFHRGDNENIIQILATLEVKGARGTDSSEFSLLFAWADGTLWNFWERFQAPELRIPRALWMAEQCYSQVIALQLVHNERDETLRLTDVEDNNHDLYGRHGDVKAENTLWFEDRDILVMTDFGLGRLHSKISISQDTRSSAGTQTYRAPEIDIKGGKVTRACDIYAMGCMFLEFITWHLEGYKSVYDDFTNARLVQINNEFTTDTFFEIRETPDKSETAITKPQVTAWIKRLKRNPACTHLHLDFLDLIENDMLQPEPQKRIKTPRLKKRLWDILQVCRSEDDYYELPASPSKNE